MQVEQYLRQLEDAIKSCNVARISRRSDGDTDFERPSEAAVKALALSEWIAGRGSVFYNQIKTEIDKNGLGSTFIMETIGGTLRALKSAVENGLLITLKSDIQAELFSDFLERAASLLSEDHKDAAAMIAGNVLEIHLQELCKKHNVNLSIERNGDLVPKKSALLNDELSNAGVYTKLDAKNVTAWLGLRNLAAHGKYSEYGKEQVNLLISGVRDFISRNRV